MLTIIIITVIAWLGGMVESAGLLNFGYTRQSPDAICVGRFFWRRRTMYKTHTCGELRRNSGQTVTLAGWVHRRRVRRCHLLRPARPFWPGAGGRRSELSPEAHQALEPVRLEWVIQVEGVVRRPPGRPQNPNLPTGEIEVVAQQVTRAQPGQDHSHS